MKINGLKKIIILIIILIITLILAIILININREKPQPNIENELIKEANKGEYKIQTTLQEFSDTNMYFAVKNIIEKYYSSCKDVNINAEEIQIHARAGKSTYNEKELQQYKEQSAKEMQDKAIEKVYNMLSEDYIKEFNINKQDIKQKMELEYKYSPVIEEIYRFQNSNNVWTYLVKGINVDIVNKKSEHYFIAVTVDIYNKTFCIYPQEYLEKHEYDKLQLGDEVEKEISEIEKSNDNTYNFEIIKDDEICKEYFNRTKKIILYDTDFSYEMLDKEYRGKRFNSLEEYKDWVQKYYNILNSSVESKYQVTNENGNKRYICQDDKGLYYVFNKKDTVDFTINLDTYTIDTKEFLDTYKKEDDKEKAQMNIEKVFQAINRKDYNYVYKYLDESYKNNNFSDVDKLEKYLENNLYEINNIKSKDYKNEGEIQIFDIIVQDYKDSSKNKNMTIIIKIKEDTDFVMSFNIQ